MHIIFTIHKPITKQFTKSTSSTAAMASVSATEGLDIPGSTIHLGKSSVALLQGHSQGRKEKGHSASETPPPPSTTLADKGGRGAVPPAIPSTETL